MTIKFSLKRNAIRSDEDNYFGFVETNSSFDIEDIARRMVEQGSTITKTDIIAVMEEVEKATISILLEGNRVNLGGLVQLYPRIKGTFDSLIDSFDRSRHGIDISARPGNRVRKYFKENATVEKLPPKSTEPMVFAYKDLGTEDLNSTITAGKIATVYGKLLKFDSIKADEGIFIINSQDGSEEKITEIQRNMPSELVFQVPSSLVSGNVYKIEVRTRTKGSNELKMGRLKDELAVS